MSCGTSLVLLNYMASRVYLGWDQGVRPLRVKLIPDVLGKCSETRTAAAFLTLLLRLPGD